MLPSLPERSCGLQRFLLRGAGGCGHGDGKTSVQEVAGEVQAFEDGKVLAFDDGSDHRARTQSSSLSSGPLPEAEQVWHDGEEAHAARVRSAASLISLSAQERWVLTVRQLHPELQADPQRPQAATYTTDNTRAWRTHLGTSCGGAEVTSAGPSRGEHALRHQRWPLHHVCPDTVLRGLG